MFKKIKYSELTRSQGRKVSRIDAQMREGRFFLPLIRSHYADLVVSKYLPTTHTLLPVIEGLKGEKKEKRSCLLF